MKPDVSSHGAKQDSPILVVVVGLPGVGKSSVGRRVAQSMKWEFVDLDTEIESRTKKTIREIFSSLGEQGFRDIETDMLGTVLRSGTSRVVATGGGVVTKAENRTLLQQADVVIWLKAPLADLVTRLAHSKQSGQGHRPILDHDPAATLRRLEAERNDLYDEVATDVVSTAHSSIDRIVGEVIHLIEQRRAMTFTEGR